MNKIKYIKNINEFQEITKNNKNLFFKALKKCQEYKERAVAKKRAYTYTKAQETLIDSINFYLAPPISIYVQFSGGEGLDKTITAGEALALNFNKIESERLDKILKSLIFKTLKDDNIKVIEKE